MPAMHDLASFHNEAFLLQRDGHAAVHEQAGAVHISREITREEQGGPCEVLWPAEPAERNTALLVRALDGVRQVFLVDVGLDRACILASDLSVPFPERRCLQPRNTPSTP